ncbi:MAG: hypothetical protein IJH94_02910 [Clostridia bacterium]|nr:hypothetical protein [Clostridia bacterium]
MFGRKKRNKTKPAKLRCYMKEALECASSGENEKCSQIVLEALKYYGDIIRGSFNPYLTDDAPFIMMALRHIAKGLEKSADNTVNMYNIINNFIKLEDIEIKSMQEKQNENR